MGAEGTHEDEGIYIGLVGARFEKPHRMEYVHMLVTGMLLLQIFYSFTLPTDENAVENGFGPQDTTSPMTLWAKFYQSPSAQSPRYYFPLFENLQQQGTSLPLLVTKIMMLRTDSGQREAQGYILHMPTPYSPRKYFSKRIFKLRMRLTLEILFQEAEVR